MAETVRAAVLVGPKMIEFREFPVPALGPDDALLRIEACGICGTDYEQYQGEVPPHEYYTPFPTQSRRTSSRSCARRPPAART